MELQPLGDQAVLARCADEQGAHLLAAAARAAAPDWLVDVVQAYTTVAVYFDPNGMEYIRAAAWMEQRARSGMAGAPLDEGRTHRIPCCYELGLDLERIAAAKSCSREAVIEQHCGQEYTVYAIGFCPGFPYLGYLPESLAGVPRLESPRLRVEAGSVGLTGRQTGIYTEPRPGGWNIVGQTPLTLVDVANAYFPLQTGDRVRFFPIDASEFNRRLGERLD